MAGIFISYRRDDSAGFAGRLYGELCDRFGSRSVFRDLDTIQAGASFPDAIAQALRSCDVFIAVIGQQWLSSAENGRRRLQNPQDYVRQEIEVALRQGILVIPMLVQGAAMPRRQDLPATLAPLADKQARTLSDSHWQVDIERLLEVLRQSPALAAAQQPAELGQQVKILFPLGIALAAVGAATDLDLLKVAGTALILGSGILFLTKYLIETWGWRRHPPHG